MNIPVILLLPFILMLGAIALFPLVLNHFWENNQNKLTISLVLSSPIIIYFSIVGLTAPLIHTVVFDYVPFIILLGALYVITGGIFLSGDLEATPATNTAFLAVGALSASIMGTTGASMLLIRPVLQTNKERTYRVHTILFFIGIVANCGGLLTPLGDPPLFMMYLRGAPFFWFLNMVPEWLTANILLLIIYFLVDSYLHKKEPASAIVRDKTNIKPLRLQGKMNFFWLLGVILAVAFINKQYLPFIETNHYFGFIREAVIVGMAVCSLLFTTHLVRVSNSFTWGPIEEVAYLFIGIFITMVPCLLYLESHAATLGVNTPIQFYYYSGLLSSFLDNTPTAVTFHSLALGFGITTGTLVAGIPENLLIAICNGAVFFGAMTYIGNGPNFMVKAIAEEQNVKMPHFFGYMYKFSLIVLLPVYILIQWLFIH